MTYRPTWLVLGVFACSGDKATDDTGTATPGFVWPDNTAEAVTTYAALVDATYGDALAGAQALDGAVDAFLADPTAGTLDAARAAWLDSREPYLLTEVFRFYDGPIDDPTDGPEGLINAWPLDENYIDYVVDAPDAGIVNDPSVPIDAGSLASLNEQGGEANIATGYHAIEFLLWGQDLSDTGPGARPHTDYLPGGTAANQDRRGTYLAVTSDLLVTHLSQVRGEWAADGAYRTAFEADPADAFRKILTGMIVLSGFETGGERLQAALDSGDREDEHSCFSDNTHRDMIQDVRGIQNVWLGSYGPVSGAGVRDVVAAVDPDLADRLDTRIAESLALAEALEIPFEMEILPGSPGNARVEALVVSLRDQESLLFEVFDAFGLTVTLPE